MSDNDVTMTGTTATTSSTTAGKTVAIREKEYNPSADLQLLRFFYSEFFLACHAQKCGTPLRVEDASSHIETWVAEIQCIPPLRQVSEITCWKCSARTCIGCGSKPKLSQENIFTPVGVINHCCPQSRLFGIWLLLSRFDEENLRAKKAIADANTKRDKPHKITKKSGVGYASDGSAHGYDWVGGIRHRAADAAPTAEHPGDIPDDLVTETLRLLNGFLSTSSDDADDFPPVELSMLRLSMLIDQVAVLLRNDSLGDWKDRKALYRALLSFVREIFRHPKMTEIAFERRPGKTTSPGLRALTESSRFRLTFDAEKPSASLFECIENIYRQARMYLDISKKTEKDAIDKDSIQISQDVVSLYEVMNAKTQKRPATVNLEQPWVQYMAENRVTFTDDVLASHRYHKAFSAVKDSNIGRLSTIGKEIANMTTSLPPGIFLKVAESRSDVMKVLIVGPEGGPYAGGLFIFDIFLPATYPISPPQMYFVLPTADDDGSNFNPNLHMGGNVCLSILNTWHGAPQEMWQPNKSTILSVLISVQAMILGAPFPWANEPGRENSGDTDVSRAYNMSIQCKTVRGAMMFWLNESALLKTNAAIWKDVSEVYWRYNKEDVLRSVVEWSKDGNDRLAAYTGPHASIPHKPKSKSKSKKDAPKSDIDVESENLIEQLAKHLGLSVKEEDYAPVDTSSRKRKTPNGSETSSKKTKKASELPTSFDNEAFDDLFFHGGPGPEYDSDPVIEDEDFDSLDEEYVLKQVKQLIDPAGDDADMEPKWVYTGAKTIKAIRQACEEFGIKAAKSIFESISKLENYVNSGKGVFEPTLLNTWGKMTDGSGSVSGIPNK